MNRFKYLVWVLVAAVFTSCSVTRNTAYVPTTAQLNIEMSDLEYLGQTEISVDYRSYLGFISRIDQINGQPYDRVERQHANLNGYLTAPRLYNKLGRAASKVIEEYPEATYFIVVRQQKHKTRLFLGAEVEVKATVKAYSFK